MYKIQRKQTIEDELVIENSKGKEALRLPVKIYVDDVLGQYNRIRAILGEAQYHVQKDPTNEKAIATVGLSVVALFKLIFGEDGGQRLVDYYEKRYTEMLADVAPFVSEVINPQMQAAMMERTKRFQRLAK